MVQHSTTLDATFAAVADPVRRGILERLGREAAWIARYQQMVEEQMDALGQFLERTTGDEWP